MTGAFVGFVVGGIVGTAVDGNVCPPGHTNEGRDTHASPLKSAVAKSTAPFIATLACRCAYGASIHPAKGLSTCSAFVLIKLNRRRD
jgi:hypothetical protein